MSEPTDKQLPDGELDEYLKGDSSVSRQYRQLHSAEVPAELDRLVLRHAHEAVKVAPAKSRAWMRWSGPLALAASAVLVVSIVIETGVQDEVTLTAEKSSAPAAPRMEAKRQSAPVENDAAETSASGSAASEAPMLPQSAPPPSPPQGVAEDRAAAQFVSPPEIRLDMPAPASAPAEPLSSAQMQEESAQPPAEKSERVLPKVARERRAAGAPPPVAAPNAAPRAEADVEEAVVTGNAVTSRPVSAMFPQFSDPERWLQLIRELRKENKQTEADREWRRFREAFPDHPVSEVDAARTPGDRR